MQNDKSDNLYVSLTSFPPRFETLAEVLSALLQQSLKPGKICLWIYHNDLKKLQHAVPKSILKRIKVYGCEELYSYKKILPLLKRNPSVDVVTADDDVIYPRDWLQSLVEKSNECPGHVVAHRVHKITLDKSQNPNPYKSWQWCDESAVQPSPLNFQTEVGGVLYPCGSLNKRVLEVEMLQKLCPGNDDIWLYFMTRLNNNYVVATGEKFQYPHIPESQNQALWKTNVERNRNDRYFRNMASVFGSVWIE
mgnify:FL=1